MVVTTTSLCFCFGNTGLDSQSGSLAAQSTPNPTPCGSPHTIQLVLALDLCPLTEGQLLKQDPQVGCLQLPKPSTRD